MSELVSDGAPPDGFFCRRNLPSAWRCKRAILMISIMSIMSFIWAGWRARLGPIQNLGFDFAAYRQRDCGFVVTRHEIDYKAAALANETVHIATWVSVNDGRLRLRRRFQMLAGDGRELARGSAILPP